MSDAKSFDSDFCLFIALNNAKELTKSVETFFVIVIAGWKMLFNLLISLSDLLWTMVSLRAASINYFSHKKDHDKKRRRWNEEKDIHPPVLFKRTKSGSRSFSLTESGNRFRFQLVLKVFIFFLFILSCRFPICFPFSLEFVVRWAELDCLSKTYGVRMEYWVICDKCFFTYFFCFIINYLLILNFFLFLNFDWFVVSSPKLQIPNSS